MRRFFTFVLLCFLYSPLSFANPAWDYSSSLKSEIAPLKMDRFNDTAGQIWLALPSYLEKWGVINSDAAASYNGILNTIVLKNDAMAYDEFGKFRLPKVSELKSRFQHAYSIPLSTIFHEMAHAQFDLFVEQEASLEDAFLYQTLQRQIYPWLKRNYPEKSYLSLKIAISELFAYYYGDLLMLIIDDVNELIATNGYDMQAKICRNSKTINNLASQLKPEEFVKILPLANDLDTAYSQRLKLETIWTRGQELELKTKNTADPFRPEWHKVLWSHFYHFYNPPRTKAELVKTLNSMPYWSSRIRSCRENLLRQK